MIPRANSVAQLRRNRLDHIHIHVAVGATVVFEVVCNFKRRVRVIASRVNSMTTNSPTPSTNTTYSLPNAAQHRIPRQLWPQAWAPRRHPIDGGRGGVCGIESVESFCTAWKLSRFLDLTFTVPRSARTRYILPPALDAPLVKLPDQMTE